MQQHHRYTGPELSALLEQVRSELGADATIIEAKKVRSRGLAGFFATEQFEVVATPAMATAPAIELPEVREEATTGGPSLTINLGSDRRARRSRPHEDVPGGVSTALLDRADAISVQERIGLSRQRPASRSTPGEINLRDTVETAANAPSIADPVARVVSRRSDDDPSPPSSFDELLAAELRSPEVAIAPGTADSFWDRLSATERRAPRRNLLSPIVAIVGEISAGIELAGRLDFDDDGAPPTVIVNTADPEDPRCSSWQTVNDLAGLEERVRFWAERGRTCAVVVDSDLGADAKRAIDLLRREGSTVLRMAVDDELDPTSILSLMQRLGGNVIADITFQADPAYVLGLVDNDVPVATVAGRSVDATLLLAMAAVARG